MTPPITNASQPLGIAAVTTVAARLKRVGVKTRPRPVIEIASVAYPRPRRWRRWPWLVGALAAVIAAAAGFAFFAWPRGALTNDADALARLRGPSFGSAGTTISARMLGGAAL